MRKKRKLKIRGPSLRGVEPLKKKASRFFVAFVLAVLFASGYILQQNGCIRIPKISLPKWRPSPAKTAAPAAPPPVKIRKVSAAKPKIAIVIDDIGYNLDNLQALKNLSGQVTYAILPKLPYSKFFGKLSEQTGAQVILHLPLESKSGVHPGPGLIKNQMSESQVLAALRENLDNVPNLSGVNNHMGSKGTASLALMRVILAELKARGMFFLDSRTTPDTAAPAAANEIGLPLLARDVFLDNENDASAIRTQLQLLAARAAANGYAIGIGHYRRITLEVLREEIPRLKQEGFEIVNLSELIAFLRLA